MAESSFPLSMNFDELKAQVAHHLYGGSYSQTVDSTTFDNLDSPEKEVVQAVVRSGLRGFYTPVPIRQRPSHKWSFLEKVATLVLNDDFTTGTVNVAVNGITVDLQDIDEVAQSWPATFTTGNAANWMFEIDGISYPVASRTDTNTLVLDADDNPDSALTAKTFRLHQDDYLLDSDNGLEDFGNLVGPVTFVEKENAWYSISVVGEGRIRELRQRDRALSGTSKPSLVALSPVAKVQTSGTRMRMSFWPSITSDFVLKFRYRVRPDTDLNDLDYPYGASEHSETILYSCLAEAERRLDEVRGVYYARFLESLAASIDVDNRVNKPKTLGYNADRSDEMAFGGHGSMLGSSVRHKDFNGNFTE